MTFEFYHGYGLGILQISEDEKCLILKFLIENAQYIRNYFANLGEFIEKELEYQAKLSLVEQERAEYQAKLSLVEDELVRVYLSKSWKITRPLRWLGRKLRI